MTIIIVTAILGFFVFFSAVFGAIYGIVLRKFHERPFRVGLGAAYYFLLLTLVLISPPALFGFFVEDIDSSNIILWMLPATILLLVALWRGWIRHLPILGGPLVSHMLALARMNLAMSKRQVERFEKFENQKLSRAAA